MVVVHFSRPPHLHDNFDHISSWDVLSSAIFYRHELHFVHFNQHDIRMNFSTELSNLKHQIFFFLFIESYSDGLAQSVGIFLDSYINCASVVVQKAHHSSTYPFEENVGEGKAILLVLSAVWLSFTDHLVYREEGSATYRNRLVVGDSRVDS